MEMNQDIPRKTELVREKLQLVIHQMRAGRIREAEAICREVLGSCPGDAAVHHLLGLLNYQLGRHEVAVELIEKAIELKPDEEEYHSNYGVVLLAAGQPEKAVAACSRAVALRDKYPEGFNNLGNALAGMGRLNEAVSAYDRALKDRPVFVEALNNRGNALKQLGDFEEAITAYQQAIVYQPNYADAHSNLGTALQMAGRDEEAIASYRRAAALQGANGETWKKLGGLLFNGGKLEEALECYSKAVSLRTTDADSLNHLGLVLQRLGRTEEAISNHRRALELRPEFPDGLISLGNALRQSGQLDEGIECFRRSLAMRPKCPDTLTFLGAALQEQSRLTEAISMHRQAIEIRPDHVQAHLNLALVLLAQGNFQEGWPEYEWRRKDKTSGESERDFASPQWHGEALAGRRILIHAEQGVGDVIQFVRYMPLVAGRGGRVVLECYRELSRLFRGMDGVEEIVIAGEPVPRVDMHCPILSLPLAFGTTLDSIPVGSPYLHADPALIEHWAKKMASVGSGKKVGIAWAGRPTHLNDHNRSIPEKLFNRLGGIPGIRYISLQKGPSAWPAAKGDRELDITDWTGELTDFADTAAIVANLDLVVTVDTSVAHLAGAMGKPAWVLIPHPADFRWLLAREDSPWYPSLRLFRQRRRGDWPAAIDEIAEQLRKLVGKEQPCPP
jgi:tetratricopeptide (TPR) repeat protein